MPVTSISIFQQTSKIHCFAHRTDYFSILFDFNVGNYSLVPRITQDYMHMFIYMALF